MQISITANLHKIKKERKAGKDKIFPSRSVSQEKAHRAKRKKTITGRRPVIVFFISEKLRQHIYSDGDREILVKLLIVAVWVENLVQL